MNKSATSFLFRLWFDSLWWKYFLFSLLDSVSDLNSRWIIFYIDITFLDFFKKKFSIFLEWIFDLVCSFCRDLHKYKIVVFGKLCSLFIGNFSTKNIKRNITRPPYRICFLQRQNTFKRYHLVLLLQAI